MGIDFGRQQKKWANLLKLDNNLVSHKRPDHFRRFSWEIRVLEPVHDLCNYDGAICEKGHGELVEPSIDAD